MAGNSQMIILLVFLLSRDIAEGTIVKDEGGDLEAAEANGKLEIIKQIKKVNDDGSYTIGYEADDGSFKIESRDVLGNIKGTYGYIDDSGQIKRVSYSSNNTTEITPTSTTDAPSVVQRIPAKLNRTTTPTKRTSYTSTTQLPPTTTSVIQAIPRRRVVSSTALPVTTTENYVQFSKEPVVLVKSTTNKPTTSIYETSTPVRLLAQTKPLLRSTSAPQSVTQKSEGQLLRPEITPNPTDGPLYRKVPVKTSLLDDETKPVSEEPEVRGNLLRRQLPQEKVFDPRQHALNAQQAAGDDSVDVYSSSVTTGPPRPLFTTSRSRVVSTTAPPVIHRPNPTIRFPVYQKSNGEYHQNYQSTVSPVYPQGYQKPMVSSEYPQESSTETSVTPSPVPVVQIPANAEEPQRQQFVELRHPFHRGAILVPVNSLQGRRAPLQQSQEYQQIIIPAEQRPQEPVYLRRMPKFRPIPVHVDENGFIREYPQSITPTPYPIQQRPQYVTQADIINEVDQIKPPVSTKDFQKLLEQLIIRQSRLEKISLLTHQDEMFRQRSAYQDNMYQNPVQFVPRTQTAQPQQQHPVIVRPQNDHYNQYAPVTFTPPSNYHPTKRMARLQQEDEEYLPAPVREMLLLRMLQLAINPSLPLELSDNLESATTPHPIHPRKEAVRNVEILGEEDERKRPSRTKRYKEIELDYFD